MFDCVMHHYAWQNVMILENHHTMVFICKYQVIHAKLKHEIYYEVGKIYYQKFKEFLVQHPDVLRLCK